MRSKLFVPGSRPELFPKALAGSADAISFDLEDAVAPSRKPEARNALRTLLRDRAALSDHSAQSTGKTLIVRVNAFDTPYFAQDIEAVVQPGLHMVNLPKPANAQAVRNAVAAIERAERANGFNPDTDAPVALLLNIETAEALRTAHELSRAHARVIGLQLGLADLFEPLGVMRTERAAVMQAMMAVRLAAGEAGIFAYDTAFANVKDAEGFASEAALSRRLGFLGKSCIHPSQVSMANAAFQPTPEEISHALAVVDASHQATQNGVGAYMVEGQMIDPPFLLRAQAIVANARQLGLLPASL